MKKTIRKLTTLTLTAALLFSLTACGSKSGSGSKWNNNTSATQSAPAEATAESAATIDESLLADGKITSSAWKDGVLKINGKIFTLSKTTLEQFAKESGYSADDTDMNYIIYDDSHSVTLDDGKHQKTEVTSKNYASDKPLYCKHALISGYNINFATENGLEGADAILPGNIKGGMTKSEIIAIVGVPEEDDSDTLLSYDYKENDMRLYSVSFHFDYDTHTLSDVSYFSYMDFANVADDSDTIQSSLDTTSSSSLTDKSTPSDILKDAEIKIGSKVYAMPISMTDLTELGYSMDEEKKSYVLNPKEEIDFSEELKDKGGNIFCAESFFNPSDSPRVAGNCLISKLRFTSDAEKVSVAKEIKIGSSYQKVCDAFGKRKKGETDNDESYCLTYTYSAKRGEVEATFFFSKKNDKVIQIDMSVKELTQD